MKWYGYCPYEDIAADQPVVGEESPHMKAVKQEGIAKRRIKMKRKELAKVKRDAALKELRANPDDRRHGKMTGYQHGCRCERCWQAYKDMQARKKQLK